MPELLFEIGTEELPSWYVAQAGPALRELVVAKLAAAHLRHGEVRRYATPRRLAVHVLDLAEASEVRTERRRGPSADVAFDESGAPRQAALGFAQSSGVAPEELLVEETERGRYVFAERSVGGTPARELLPELLAETVAELPAPRKMRWGEVDTPFVRPVAWLLALLDDEVLPVEAAGVRSGRTTYGHRFLAPDPIELARPGDYPEALRRAMVLAAPAERDEATVEAARTAASAEGLALESDPALRREVADLVEYPVGVLGRFDDGYLELPDEVLTTVMIHHQRYFPTRRGDGSLAARFVAISNNRVPDEGVIRTGYEKVLGGRLYDARFFWDTDRRKSLSQHAWKLSGIQFHKELGSMADKVARVGEVAQRLAERLGLTEEERTTLESALPIFKADLSTEMVQEFPELEGTMARAYAAAEGQPAAVARALEEGVLPKGPESSLPASRPGAVLSVADRLDKLVGFFAVGKRPSGSADPFGLRRDANALARTLNAQGWRVPLRELVAAAAEAYGGGVEVSAAARDDVEEFLWDRVRSLLGEEDVGVHAVRAATGDRPAVITAARRAHLLRALGGHAEFPVLMALFKRAANLAAKAPRDAQVRPKLFESPHEAPLHEALPAARRGVERLLAEVRRTLVPWDLGRGPSQKLGDLGEAVEEVLLLKAPLDAFLDHVLVMVDEEPVRENRLALLAAVRDTLRELGHLEELEGA